MEVSVVVPFFNSEATLGSCLAALLSQKAAGQKYEIIAVDDGSSDGGAAIAQRAGVRLVQQPNRGAPAARNAGIAAAVGKWVAFTDADCIPSRGWLRALLTATETSHGNLLGAAGPIVSQPSSAPPARFVEISGGLDTAWHLRHPKFPFAPTGNVMYRRGALEAVGGFDERYAAYDACDLHRRLMLEVGGEFVFAESAVVLHHHRDSWGDYWTQQVNYGRGLAQFYVKWSDDIPWSPWREAAAWAALAPAAVSACRPGDANASLARRGRFVKQLAQRFGFATTYFRPAERARWRPGAAPSNR
jgi:glycosyltransferase involved in cell wall biosynthesis